MLLKITLATASLIAVACTANADQEQLLPSSDAESTHTKQLSADELSAQKRRSLQEFSPSSLAESFNTQPLSEQRLAQSRPHPQLAQGSYMTLTKTGNTNAQGNPLYLLAFYVNGQQAASFESVTGRSHTQNKNRHVAGTEAPLPNGRYTVAGSTVPGTHSEVGDRFLPIYPQFQTGRSALGIHYDPSFGKSNGEDGTAGCIALTNRQEFDKVLAFLRTYQPQYLKVNI